MYLFSELKSCPMCACTRFKVQEKRSYVGEAIKTFDGEGFETAFTEDKLELTLGSKAYCAECGEYLGMTNSNKVSKAVKEALDAFNNKNENAD